MISFKKTQSKIVSNDLNQLDKTNEQFKVQKQKQKVELNKKYMTQSQRVSFQRSRSNQVRKEEIYHEKSEDLMNQSKKQKVPFLLKKTLHEQAVKSGRIRRIRHAQKSKYGQMISSKLRRQYQQCGICLSEMKENQKVKISNCNHFFCSSCINQYILYKIKMFQEIVCPNEQCQLTIDQQNNFYKSLPEDTKTKYIKIHNFYQTSKDPNLRLCPKQNCEGVIKIVQNQPIICDKCLKQFCPKCYFEKHQGLCDQNQINFFQNNLHYRQCSNCKFVVEKNQGCNHMTCRCKHQFCYVCGGAWSQNHICNRLQGGQAVIQNIADDNCCNCNCADQCGSIGCILKFPIRLIVWLLFISVIMGILVSKFLIKHTFIFIGALFVGSTLFTVQFLCKIFQNSLCIGITLLILFPIALMIGIFKAVYQICLDVFGEDCEQLIGVFASITALIFYQ